MEKLREKLEKLSKKETVGDNEDFNAYDYSGGNYDDAYNLGYSDGEIFLARELLEMIYE